MLVLGLGQFISRDSIEYRSGVTLYGYCDGAPLIRTDPSGNAWFVIIGGGAAAIGCAWGYKCDPPGSYDWLTDSEDDDLAELKKEMTDALANCNADIAASISSAIEDCPIVGKFERGNSVDGEDGTSLTYDGGWACPTKVVLANDFFDRDDKCTQYFTLFKECYRRAAERDFDDTGESDNRASDDFDEVEDCLGCEGHQ